MGFEYTPIEMEITVEDILSSITEEDIFCRYMNILQVKKGLYCSPIRDDKNPTCSFFRSKTGTLYLKDFGTGDCTNAFTLVKKLFNCDFHDALNIIANDFGIRASLIAKKMINFNKTKYKFKEAAPTKIQVEIKDFTEEELNWWKQFNIDERLLKRYNVFSLNYVFLNDSVFAQSTPKCPIYGYYFGKKDGLELWRLYFPFNRKYRFLSNTPGTVLQGLSHLKKTNGICIITKSYKDVISLASFGISAIAPCSENLFCPDNILEKLKRRFSKIVVFYDNDIPGIHNMRKIKKEHPELCYFFIPRKFGVKDFSDAVKKYGYDKIKQVINYYLSKLENEKIE